jgi:hypothetical protein
MMFVTPLVSVSDKKKMKKEMPGPRAETLLMIRHFARIYEYEPERKRKIRSELLN